MTSDSNAATGPERAVILLTSSLTVMAGAILAPSLPKIADAILAFSTLEMGRLMSQYNR